MINTLLGIKKGMTSTYDSRGRRVGATVVEIQSNFVTQIKTNQTPDNYSAIQLGVGTKKSVNKPQLGHTKKIGLDKPIRWFREVRASEAQKDLQPGTEITLNQVFSKGDEVKVSGTSKGKGFQGGVRRYGFHGGPKTHGQSDRHRAPGSIGAGTTPGRVYKGKHMAGHMGAQTASTRGLEVINVDKANNLLVIKGSVPGAIGNLVTVTKLGRIRGYTPPPEEKPDEEESSESVDQRVSESEVAENTDTPIDQDTEGTPVVEEASSPIEDTKEEEKQNAG